MRRVLTAGFIVALYGSCTPICACTFPTYAHVLYGDAPFAGTDSAWKYVEAEVGTPPCDAFVGERTSGAGVSPDGSFRLMAITTNGSADLCVRVRFIENDPPSGDSLTLTPFLATFTLEREDSTHVVLPP